MSRPVRSPRTQALVGLHLMGAGLDAIVQRTLLELSLEDAFMQHQRHQPAVTAAQRLARYERACAARPDRQAELRRMIGEGYQAAWRRGRWPRLVTIARDLARIERSRLPC
ncbi:hypothetical protein [Xanthomonas theicola]|uniref:Uncharacterized protein n=1 Tax=Xanthomonas theicola TaxID=56464 RepID=A0A2S6ZLV3_9XANT|nr:hypothetical protein [Xanthomonas theicola]PPT93238.1 hypothetical protein XthCFBP4691_01095 [Xanthomonas theicola]QNH24827.1 hypothetical protein G4Q83_08805 [Xanthomonas theicola]